MTELEYANMYLGEFKVVGDEIKPLYCPFCGGGNHQDRYTFALNMENHTFNCMRGSCGVKGHFSELCREKNLRYDDPADPAAKAMHYLRIQMLAAEFRSQHGTLICRELLADQHPDTAPNPTPRTDDFYRQRPCARFVEDAARILDAYLEKEPPKNNLQ